MKQINRSRSLKMNVQLIITNDEQTVLATNEILTRFVATRQISGFFGNKWCLDKQGLRTRLSIDWIP